MSRRVNDKKWCYFCFALWRKRPEREFISLRKSILHLKKAEKCTGRNIVWTIKTWKSLIIQSIYRLCFTFTEYSTIAVFSFLQKEKILLLKYHINFFFVFSPLPSFQPSLFRNSVWHALPEGDLFAALKLSWPLYQILQQSVCMCTHLILSRPFVAFRIAYEYSINASVCV